MLLEYVDQLSNPEKLINQYGPDVTIGQIKPYLEVAFLKLSLYACVVQSAVRVSMKHSHQSFDHNATVLASGFTSDFSNRCSICDKELIDYQHLLKFRRTLHHQKDQQNTWQSILVSSLFTFNISGKGVADVSFPDADEARGRTPRMKSLLMYRCGHQFHKGCVRNRFNEENNVEVIGFLEPE